MQEKPPLPEPFNLEKELLRIMNLLASTGVNYPAGYGELLIRKYKKDHVRYPRILMRMGEPNIRKHQQFQKILELKGAFLDYGCGTGDDIRALVKSGYPPQKIVGYDVNWSSINLGFDLYLDRDTLGIQLTVAKEFPFQPSTFDVVYSGSVIHVLRTKRIIKSYISNAYTVLKPAGILFGSTLGFRKGEPSPLLAERRQRRGWLQRLRRKRVKPLSREELDTLLHEAGFSEIQVSYDEANHRLWFYAQKLI
ncbi:MAG: class I SAM-dependent methyltransferase [Candidatus Helarchaeota archaeon]|nr:class I SAM-dependent methyltransferase [Candidatus Helarchaeota archaeon]